MSTDEERAAAKEAQEILGSLTPSTPRVDQIILTLGHAAGVATEGSIGLPAESALSYVRAATALRAVCFQLEQQNLRQFIIDRAKHAVEAWVNRLQ